MNNFYVYCLRRPDKKDPLSPNLDQPFYIGKGCGKRIKQHRIDAVAYKNGNLSYKSPKNSTIVSLWNKGLDFKKAISDGLRRKNENKKRDVITSPI